MKIHILFDFEKPSGGGKNFLMALRSEFEKAGVHTASPKDADVILFNSHQTLKEVFQLKLKFSEKLFVHRIDGPICSYRKNQKYIDKAIFEINKLVANGTVFQSKWSQTENKKMMGANFAFDAVILNGANRCLFNKDNKAVFEPTRKIRLIAASWSKSDLKGFDVLLFLDKQLDFAKYEMVFAGESPLEFTNIKVLGKIPQDDLAKRLKQSDIFISTSRVEACSNALIEALSCGLPCLAFNSSSNPEVLQGGGELFSNEQDLLLKIEKIRQNYRRYQNNLPVYSMQKTTQEYLQFMTNLCYDIKKPKRIGFLGYLRFLWVQIFLIKGKIFNKI